VSRRGAPGIVDAIEAELRLRGTRERAEGARHYLKSDLEFVGADAAAVRASVRGALANADPIDRRTLVTIVGELWERRVFELRACAVELLTARGALLRAGDAALVKRLLLDSHTWALVDGLAIHVAGPLVERFPVLEGALDRWATDPDFWLRRAAMLALLVPLRRGAGDFRRFSRYADRMLEEEEFFIRKAIGWVLREVGKRRPGLVARWVEARTDRISGVTVREAVRYLPEHRRKAILAAYRRGRERSPVTGKGGTR
jgi:3-methyladenine DNA glycosylase AlkD